MQIVRKEKKQLNAITAQFVVIESNATKYFFF